MAIYWGKKNYNEKAIRGLFVFRKGTVVTFATAISNNHLSYINSLETINEDMLTCEEGP